MSTLRVRKCGYCKETGHNSRTCNKKLQDMYARQQLEQNQQGQQPQTQAEPQQEQSTPGKLDLGMLPLGNRQVFVSLIPSQAESVIVKYQPEVQVSCVIPPQDIVAMYGYGRGANRKKPLNITTPHLIMSCGYGDVPNPRTYMRVMRPYTFWAIDTSRNDEIWTKPYLFSNVWTNGKVCFGGLKPSSLRQAYNTFWSSGFNGELYREEQGIKHICSKKVHNYRHHRGHSCDPTKKQHSCACSKTTFHRHNRSDGQRGGCGCTSVTASKSCKGACQYAEETRCDCCNAIKARQQAALQADATLGTRKLAKLATTDNLPYPGCGCTFRHKRGCGCGKNTCNCPCQCACCTATCNHGNCQCSCCKNECSCSCRCNIETIYQTHLETYHDVQIKNQKWVKRSQVFCGSRFWAAPQGADGVLLSNERLLLNAIPRKYWRKDQNGNALVIALANRRTDGAWEFESGGFTFQLSPQNVVSK